MKSQDISNVLNKFIDNRNEHSLLIDGKWGCGKTYQILEFLNKSPSSKIYYISVFGYSSTDEINTDLYWKIHKGYEIAANVGMIISKVVNPLVNSYVDLKEGLNYALKKKSKEIGSDYILILDDIERVGKKLDYIDLCGYITHLILNKSKVIAICDSTYVSSDKKDNFQEFLEKTFDRILTINETPKEIIEGKLEKEGFSSFDIDLSLFDQNIRTVDKSISAFKKICNKLNDLKINYIETVDDSLLFTLCVVATKASFSIRPEKQTDDKDFRGWKKLYGEDPAIGMIAFIGDTEVGIDKNPNLAYSSLLEAIYEAIVYDSYDKLKKELKPKGEEKVVESAFFLSDEGKNRYGKEFIQSVLKADSIGKEEVDKLWDILKYTKIKVTDQQRRDIIRKAYHSVNLKKIIEVDYNYDYGPFCVFNDFDMGENYFRLDELQKWRRDIHEIYQECMSQCIESALNRVDEEQRDWLLLQEAILRLTSHKNSLDVFAAIKP